MTTNGMPVIAAIATAQAAGGIGVIRISGDGALETAQKVFVPVSGASLCLSAGYRAYFGAVVHNNIKIDEAVCLVFRNPHSYTGEDVVEISMHGGLWLLGRALEAVYEAGAQPAQPGEFTKRAFLNGKLDLSEAEAVAGLISAQGEQASKAALSALEGSLSRETNEIASQLVSCAASLAAWSDYPDEDIEQVGEQTLRGQLKSAHERLCGLLDGFEAGQAVTQGVATSIVGRPNVGKSTLMNLLTGFERSIVTSYAGTTRDIVEETVRVGNITLRLADTAGIHDTDNPVENAGIVLARKKLDRAALVLAVFDGSDELSHEDTELLDMCCGKPTIAVVNKTDLPCVADTKYLCEHSDALVEISAATGEGRELLCEALERVLGTRNFNPCAALLATVRQRECARNSAEQLKRALEALDEGMTLDAIGVLIETALDSLLELSGKKASQAVIDEVFSRFCVGK